MRDQKEIGKKRRKIRWFDKVSYWNDPNNKMIINKFKFTQEKIESDYVTMKHIVINKTSEPKKWEYTYDYLFKDIDGENSFIVVDYCQEMTKTVNASELIRFVAYIMLYFACFYVFSVILDMRFLVLETLCTYSPSGNVHNIYNVLPASRIHRGVTCRRDGIDAARCAARSLSQRAKSNLPLSGSARYQDMSILAIAKPLASCDISGCGSRYV